MEAYGYDVTGNCEALTSVLKNIQDKRSHIKWSNFETGDTYFDEDGRQYEVKINHDRKQVHLVKW